MRGTCCCCMDHIMFQRFTSRCDKFCSELDQSYFVHGPWLLDNALQCISSLQLSPLSKCGPLLFMAPVSNQTLLELAQNKSFTQVVFLFFILWHRNASWHKQWSLAIILVRFCGGGLGSPNCGQFRNRKWATPRQFWPQTKTQNGSDWKPRPANFNCVESGF